METKITDINKLVDTLTSICAGCLLDDECWKCYGYKKRPKKGTVWIKLFHLELQQYITKELLTMSFIDVLSGIKKSKVTSTIKLLLSIGVLDRIYTTHILNTDSFMENVFITNEALLKKVNSKNHDLIIYKASGILNEKDLAKFAVGTIRLLLHEHPYNFIADSDYVSRLVDNSSVIETDKLHIEMPKELFDKYAPLIKEKILNF